MCCVLCKANSPYPRWVCLWHRGDMTQPPKSSAESATVAGQSGDHDRLDGPRRLSQVLAWVGIVAGTVFVLAVIFFSGLFLGWSSGDHSGWNHDPGGGRAGTCPMMGTGQMMGPGQMSPGVMMGPSQSPTTTAPSSPRP